MSPTKTEACRQALLAALREGETRRAILEPLVAPELAVLERQHGCGHSYWTHYDPKLPLHDVALLAVFAAAVDDEALWLRLVETAKCCDHAHRTMQKWDGLTEEEHLGRPASMEKSAGYVRYEADRLLARLEDRSPGFRSAIDRWTERLEQEARAEEEARAAELAKGQRLYKPRYRITCSADIPPDLKPEWERLEAEVRRRLSEDPATAADVARGSYAWRRDQFPDLAAAFDRIDDELDRRAGIPKPRILVKAGDTVYAHGKHWTVESADERTGIVYLRRSTGGIGWVSIPVDGDGLMPER